MGTARTGAARTTLGLAAGLIGAGLGFDLPTLYEPGVALALLACGAWAWVELAGRRVGVRRIAPRPSVGEDEPLDLEFEVERGRLPAPGAELRDPLLPEPLSLGPSARGRIAFTTSWPRRGRKELGPTTFAVRDPLSLHVRETAAEGAASILVLPRLEPVIASAEGGAATGALGLLAEGGWARRSAAAIEVEIDGLRPYREGSPASRIHWPTVARTGEMVERRLDAGAGARPLVVLDSSAPPSDDALDRAVRAAASLTHHLALAGGCALALSGAPRPLEIDARLRGWETAHARLALVIGGERPPALRGGRSRAAVVFWVTAAAPAAASRVRRLGAAEAFVVSPLAGATGGREVFSVAGCGGRRLREAHRATARVKERAA